MIIYSINLISLPLTLLMWMIDGYLGLLMLRLILGWIPSLHSGAWYSSMSNATDALPQFWNSWIGARWPRAHWDPRLPWVVIILVLVVVRQIIVALIMAGGSISV